MFQNKMPDTVIGLSFLAALCFGADLPTTQPQSAPVIADVARQYKSLAAVTPKPVEVSELFASLCRTVTPEAQRARLGPHSGASMMLYMNDIAHDAASGEAN